MLRFFLICLYCALCAKTSANAEQEFPEARGSRILPVGEWVRSPIVVVGEVTNISSYGEQAVHHLPYPMANWVNTLHWCQGDFLVTAVVKGVLPVPPKKFLWASGLAGCKLYDNDPALVASRYRTRAWFVREEGEYLRPVFDYGTYYFVGVCAAWEEGPPPSARERLGALLLTPEANCEPPDAYAKYFLSQVGDLACEVLGKAACIKRIRALTNSGTPQCGQRRVYTCKGNCT
jgi:hypothetical protein